MMEFLCATIELMLFLPGLLLAYLPMRQYLRMSPAKLAAVMAPLTFLLCLAGGTVSFFFRINTIWLFFPIAAILGIFYIRTLQITRWKSVSVFLAVCGAFSCLGSTAVGISGILTPGEPAPPLSFKAALFWFLICCAFVAAVWHPATHAARKLLEEDAFAQTWYVFWVLPILFIGLNLAMIPVRPDILNQGRLRSMYIVISLALLFLLLLFYALFYLMASSLNRNDRLHRENEFLSMQQSRYDSLRSAISQTREARHDMRHHFNILLNLAAILPAPEIDLCLVLSNLLENALEASLKTALARRRIKVQAHLHSGHMVLLSVENAFDGNIWEKDGIFLSSKRLGEGVGLQSVRHIAEKNGGYSRFLYEDGIFCANVILRGD